MIKNPSTFNFLSGPSSEGSSGGNGRRRISWNVKSNVDALDASTTSTKVAATLVKRIQFSKTAFNLNVQFISALKEYPGSGERKCLFMLGNLEKTPITEDAADYLVRDPENSHSLHLIPKYTKAAKTLWLDLENERPLSDEDFIDLRTNGCYYISVPSSLASSCSPGDFVQLFDVLFTVHVQREQFKNINKLSDIPESQRAWKGKMVTKKVEGSDVEYEIEVKPRKPSFKFKAKFGTKLPTVSVASLVKVYQEQRFLTYHIDNPSQEILRYRGRDGGAEDGDAYDEDVFRMKKEWYEPKDIVRIVYNAQYDGSNPPVPIIGPDGKAYSLEILSYPNVYISENDFKSDEVKFDCAKSRTNVDEKNKAWCFMIRGSQRVWKKADNPADFLDTDGYDTENPVEDSFFSAKINVYKEVIDRDFGILSDPLWTRFISCYHNYFAGIFQCTVNWKKTESRMDRLMNCATGGAGGGEHEEGGDSGASSRPFDFTLDYACNSVLFSMRDMIQQFGVPIDKKTGMDLLDKLVEIRRKPDATDMRGSVSDVSELSTKAKHSIVCLNELKSVESAKSYLRESFNRAYAILLPEPSNLGLDMFNVIKGITDESDGTALLRALHFGESVDKTKHGDELSSVWNSLKMTGYSSKALHPLIFAVGDIEKSAYEQEATTLSRFLGISSEMVPHLHDWLQGEPLEPSKGKETSEVPEPVKSEKRVTFDEQEILEMGTQNALMEMQGSYEDNADIDLPDDEVSDLGDDEEGSSARSSKRKSSSASSPIKSKSRPGLRKSVSKRPRTSRRV